MVTRTYRILDVPNARGHHCLTVYEDSWRGRERSGRKLAQWLDVTPERYWSIMEVAARLILEQSTGPASEGPAGHGDQDDPALRAAQPSV